MKKLIASCFIFLISFATCNDTTAMILKALGDSSYAWVNNAYAEENREEEALVKKGEVSDFFEEFSPADLNAAYVHVNNYYFSHDNIFPSSDYSEEVFFPPELA